MGGVEPPFLFAVAVPPGGFFLRKAGRKAHAAAGAGNESAAGWTASSSSRQHQPGSIRKIPASSALKRHRAGDACPRLYLGNLAFGLAKIPGDGYVESRGRTE